MLCFIFLSPSSTLFTFDFTPAMLLPGPPNAPATTRTIDQLCSNILLSVPTTRVESVMSRHPKDFENAVLLHTVGQKIKQTLRTVLNE